MKSSLVKYSIKQSYCPWIQYYYPPLKAIIYIKHYVEQGILRSLTFCIDAINNFI